MTTSERRPPKTRYAVTSTPLDALDVTVVFVVAGVTDVTVVTGAADSRW